MKKQSRKVQVAICAALGITSGVVYHLTHSAQSQADGVEVCVAPVHAEHSYDSFFKSLIELKNSQGQSVLSASTIQKWNQLSGTMGERSAKGNLMIHIFAELILLGQDYMRDYDALIQKGFTLQNIQSPKYDTYFRLQAIRTLREEVRDVLVNEFAKTLNESPARLDRARFTVVLARARASFEKNLDQALRLAVSKDLQSGRLSEEIFKRMKEEVSLEINDIQKYFETCDASVFGSSAHERVSSLDHESILKQSVTPGSYLILEKSLSRQGRLSLPVHEMVKALAVEVKQSMNSTNRAPRSDVEWAPSVGEPGNVVGYSYPKGIWSLTFDDGPAKTTHLVLDNLQKHSMKASFFVLTQQFKDYGFMAELEREFKDGHGISSHSYSHANMPKVSEAGRNHEINEAVNLLDKELQRISGDDDYRTGYYRLPYGAGVHVSSIRQRLADLGLIHVFWTVDTLDWQDKDPKSIFARAKTQMDDIGRGVILFHDIHPQSVVASEMVMTEIERRGEKQMTIQGAVDLVNGQAREDGRH